VDYGSRPLIGIEGEEKGDPFPWRQRAVLWGERPGRGQASSRYHPGERPTVPGPCRRVSHWVWMALVPKR